MDIGHFKLEARKYRPLIQYIRYDNIQPYYNNTFVMWHNSSNTIGKAGEENQPKIRTRRYRAYKNLQDKRKHQTLA